MTPTRRRACGTVVRSLPLVALMLLVMVGAVPTPALAQSPPGTPVPNVATPTVQAASVAAAKAIGANDNSSVAESYNPLVAADLLDLAISKVDDTSRVVTPLTDEELYKIYSQTTLNDPAALAAYQQEASPVDSDGDRVLLIQTLRIYSDYAVDHYQEYLKAHAQGMHGALKLSGMIVKPRFVTQISSTAGPYASKANEAIMKAANMSEYGGFDYTFTFGMKRGAVQTAAIGAPILNTITQYVYHEVTEAGFHNNNEQFPAVSIFYASNYSFPAAGRTSIYKQTMDMQFDLTGENLLPYIPERQTATILSFRDALVNATGRNFNLIKHSTVRDGSVSSRKLQQRGDGIDTVRITLRVEVSPPDWYTPKQLAAAALDNGAVEATSAKNQVPFVATFITATTRTLKRTNNTQSIQITGANEISGFLTPYPNNGPAAVLRNATTAAEGAAADSENETDITFIEPMTGGGSSELSTGAIAGIVIGVLGAVALVLAGGYFAVKRSRMSQQAAEFEHGPAKPLNAQMSFSAPVNGNGKV